MARMQKPLIGLMAAALSLSALGVSAAELPAGTVISAENIDKIKDDTFEGHKISSLLTEKMEWRIRNNGWKLPLANSKEVKLDPTWVKASQANAGKTKINSETCQIDGWTAGAPFPNIDMNDPQAAEKIVWNWHLGQLLGDVAIVPFYTQVLIDGEKGVHAEPIAEFTRYSMKGRLNGEHTQGDGSERGRQLLYFKAPSDMKGLGTFTIQHAGSLASQFLHHLISVDSSVCAACIAGGCSREALRTHFLARLCFYEVQGVAAYL